MSATQVWERLFIRGIEDAEALDPFTGGRASGRHGLEV